MKMVNVVLLIEKLKTSPEGVRLITEHSSLKAVNWKQLRGKIQNQDNLDYVLRNMSGDDISKEFLTSCYDDFDRVYKDLVSSFLASAEQQSRKGQNLEGLKVQIESLVDKVVRSSRSSIWNKSLRDAIPKLLAHIFTVWTIINNDEYNELRGLESSNDYLLMPHVGQVIAIFRILGIGYQEDKKLPIINITYKKKISDDLVNNLVEIGTGEGKSVVIAITACIFALIGADVVCSCYSEVLSERDMNDFVPVFRALGIEERIKYGTFNKLCEQLLNEQCNLREKVRDMILDNKSVLDIAQKEKIVRHKVLLIDEVDVFLSEKFYGGMYTPSLILKDPYIKELLDSLWKNRDIRSLNGVKALPAYEACASRYSNWISLFDEAIKDMLATLRSFKPSTYMRKNDRIVYVEGESVTDNVILGYDTIWAYYHENKNGNISSSSLEDNVGIIVNCGTFSYAEMPYEFSYIAGVSGTLKTLAESEKSILKNVYHIHRSTFMPSVFGACNRTYSDTTDVIVVPEAEYFTRIHGEIEDVCRAQRAILVFFESEEKLTAFYAFLDSSSRKDDVQVIQETVPIKERELYIKRAATIGKVTLLTRIFGRGTDFICSSPQLVLNGGVHVLQTFFSKELSEEYQIMGRGARQGDNGSYRMILLDKDLEWILGPTWKENLSTIPSRTLYQTLNESRKVRYESKCGAKQLAITQCKREHNASKDFMTAFTEGNIQAVKQFLIEQNRAANIITGISRTVLLMDATGSMSNLLTAAKETVCTMFERASAVLTEKNVPSDAFQMQFVIYRNYSSRENRVLQVSPWETKGNNLRTFMNTISPEGGMGTEAIEIGLWHAVQESESQDSISQVILIGDAPANSQEEVHRKRGKLGEKYWKTTKLDKPTHYEVELKNLKDKNIPVHAFYLDESAKTNFQRIAGETGRCAWLNIHSSEGAELLTNFVTKEVLRKAAGNQGDEAVALYKRKYEKTFTS
ncbi:unnamed protein product [Rotaria sp. Silwood1]|nr:unnamed protein product [Rotaria sp. Silwood1]